VLTKSCLLTSNYHDGGCLCGKVRYRAFGKPVRAGVCHCRYCQLRAGSAFGTLVYFSIKDLKLLSGDLLEFNFKTEMDRAWKNEFCGNCGTTLFMHLEAWPGDVGIAGGTFDPPTFWYKLSGEVFRRSKAHFIGEIEAPRKMETWFNYEAKGMESCYLDGNRNELKEPCDDKEC